MTELTASMYSACISCRATFGTNRVLTRFPHGRCIAFDPVAGRLWVVCTRCGRWNLVPLEERWEAIEECEHTFRDARQRFSADGIGLAVRDAVHLVRVGAVSEGEFAAWRYGERLRPPRWKRSLPAVAGALWSLAAGAAFGFVGVAGAGAVVLVPYALIRLWDVLRTTVRLTLPDGPHVHLSARRARQSEFIRRDSGEWELGVLRSADRLEFLQGADASRALAQVLPALRHFWPTSDEIVAASRILAHHRDMLPVFDGAPSSDASRSSPALAVPPVRLELSAMPRAYLLAVEMMVNETCERDALRGDLRELARAWHEADNIAGIADTLLLPAPVVHAFEALKRSRQPNATNPGAEH